LFHLEEIDMKKRILWLTLVTTLTAVISSASDSHFGLVTISTLDTARLTAFCDDDAAATPTPCAITFEFRDIRGAILKQSTVTLQPGTSGFLDFQPAAGGGAVGIAPCWDVERGVATASLEVFDIFTQRTRILINWGDRQTPLNGDVDFGLVGITQFDTLRLGATCEGDGSVMPPPCDITFTFSDAQGRVLKQARMVLPAEASGFLDLKLADIGVTAKRFEIAPCWKSASGTVALGSAVGSLTILDSFTGLSIAQSYPATPVSAIQ
jgi:hypothetical protein